MKKPDICVPVSNLIFIPSFPLNQFKRCPLRLLRASKKQSVLEFISVGGGTDECSSFIEFTDPTEFCGRIEEIVRQDNFGNLDPPFIFFYRKGSHSFVF